MIWHSSTSQEVLAELSTDAESGLSNGVADERLNIYGKNVISSIESPSFLKRFHPESRFFRRLITISVSVRIPKAQYFLGFHANAL